MHITKHLALQTLNYGGFCFLGHSRSFVAKPDLAQKIPNLLHNRYDATGNAGGVRTSSGIIAAKGRPVSLQPRQVYYVVSPAQGDYGPLVSSSPRKRGSIGFRIRG